MENVIELSNFLENIYDMSNDFNIILHFKFVFQEHQVKDGTALEFLMDLLSTLKVLNYAVDR